MKVLYTVFIALAFFFDSIVCAPNWSLVSIKQAKQEDINNFLTSASVQNKATLPMNLLLLENTIFGYMDKDRIAQSLYTYDAQTTSYATVGGTIGVEYLGEEVPSWLN
ncbi:uncharacterized protein LOC117179118 [Belonocnema kinseyi]|uniref:uncharacterized protein LOC117179118 n=1 Tax=Belonocnema kinseyi TaxID=2817044 RepID=UPI00143DD4D3|nr:uncharacterized protein LOC117179118 [Belonocnema kinseyi]